MSDELMEVLGAIVLALFVVGMFAAAADIVRNW